MFWPCETRTSTCRNFATISSGLYRFLAIAVLLDVKDIPQVGPLQWGWISVHLEKASSVVEVKGDTARLLSVAERTKYLFGKEADDEGGKPRRKKKEPA